MFTCPECDEEIAHVDVKSSWEGIMVINSSGEGVRMSTSVRTLSVQCPECGNSLKDVVRPPKTPPPPGLPEKEEEGEGVGEGKRDGTVSVKADGSWCCTNMKCLVKYEGRSKPKCCPCCSSRMAVH